MEWQDRGIVLASRRFGEHGAVLTLLTERRGRHPGLLRGADTGRRRAVLQPGSAVHARWRARLADNLGTYRCELATGVPPLILHDPGRLAALAASCALLEYVLPEREAQPVLFPALERLLAILAQADTAVDKAAGTAVVTAADAAVVTPADTAAAREARAEAGAGASVGASEPWAADYVRWEVLVLAELGYGLSLDACAVSGARTGLAYVSPRTGRAVTAQAGRDYRHRLLRLPSFLAPPDEDGGLGGADDPPAWDVADGLRLTGHFLERYVLQPRQMRLPPARARLLARLDGRGT
jgi:DNA repair protein RecO (recombination protein O)